MNKYLLINSKTAESTKRLHKFKCRVNITPCIMVEAKRKFSRIFLDHHVALPIEYDDMLDTKKINIFSDRLRKKYNLQIVNTTFGRTFVDIQKVPLSVSENIANELFDFMYNLAYVRIK